jgi:hypothetical protein
MTNFLERVDGLAGQLADLSTGQNYAIVLCAHLCVTRQLLQDVLDRIETPSPGIGDLVELIEELMHEMISMAPDIQQPH